MTDGPPLHSEVTYCGHTYTVLGKLQPGSRLVYCRREDGVAIVYVNLPADELRPKLT